MKLRPALGLSRFGPHAYSTAPEEQQLEVLVAGLSGGGKAEIT
jgi:hypothetical protein